MKKRIFGVILLCALLLLTGCGKEQTLRCKATESGVDIGYNVTFKGAVITKMDLSYDMPLTAYSEAQIEQLKGQDFCEVVKSSMTQYADAFSNCTQNIKDKHLLVHTDLIVGKVAKNELSKLSSIKKSKEGLEEIGYTCTIEDVK